MKPIILKVDEEGKLLISADEIQKMVDEAYQQGYSDGRASVPQTITTPYYPNTIVYSEKPWYDKFAVTC